jgi:hypothetical protein
MVGTVPYQGAGRSTAYGWTSPWGGGQGNHLKSCPDDDRIGKGMDKKGAESAFRPYFIL